MSTNIPSLIFAFLALAILALAFLALYALFCHNVAFIVKDGVSRDQMGVFKPGSIQNAAE